MKHLRKNYRPQQNPTDFGDIAGHSGCAKLGRRRGILKKIDVWAGNLSDFDGKSSICGPQRKIDGGKVARGKIHRFLRNVAKMWPRMQNRGKSGRRPGKTPGAKINRFW